jgi:hypothetical protein
VLNLRLEADTIARIAEQLAPLCEGDEQCFADMMQGETNVDHLVRRIHEQVARDEETLVGIKERQDDLSGRKDRITRRRDAMKRGIGMLMRAARLNKLEIPEATYSIREGKPTLRVIDPDAVPDEYQRVKREPDKPKINEAFAQETSLPNWLTREEAQDVIVARTK